MLRADSAKGSGSPGTATPTATVVPSSTPTPSPSPTATSVSTPTPTGTATNTATATQSPSPTFTATATATATNTPTSTPVSTPTNTPSPTPTQTQPACERTGVRMLTWAIGMSFPGTGGPMMTAGSINPYNPCSEDSITVSLSLTSPTPIEYIFVSYGSSNQSGGCVSATPLAGCPDVPNGITYGSGTALPATSGSWAFTFPFEEPNPYPINLQIYVKNAAGEWFYNGNYWIVDVPPGP